MKRFAVYALFLFLIIIFAFAGRKDSIYIKEYDKVRYFKYDSIFAEYAQNGYITVIDDIHDFYEDIVGFLTPEQQRKEILTIRRIAEKYDSQELMLEADYLQAIILPDDTEQALLSRVQKMQKVVDAAKENDNSAMKLRAMEAIMQMYWDFKMYAKAIKQAYEIDKELQNVTDEEYPAKGQAYYQIGKAFSFFQDYDKAIPYYRKALKPAKHYFDRSDLQARNAIGTYYNQIGKVDSAEYYFRSAFFSSNIVKSRSTFDAIALSNIGQSLLLKQHYDSAISYLDAGMKKMLIEYNYEFATKVSIGLAKCYMGKQNYKMTKNHIDSAQFFIKKCGNEDLYQMLYPLMYKYYAATGNLNQLVAYADSTIMVNKAYSDKYNSVYLLKAEQELFEVEKQAKDEELSRKEDSYRSKLQYGIIIILFISIAMVFFIILYRKKQMAYRALVQKNKEWAEEPSPYEDTYTPIEPVVTNIVQAEDQTSETQTTEQCAEKVEEGPTEEDRELMKKVYEAVAKEKIFKDLDLTLDSLAKQMDVNRNYLSKAINKSTNKNFNAYINEYRVKEAIKILSTEKADLISIDAIALEVGFNNRTSFYQSFKKITGLSPSDFRNNKVR